MEKSDLKQQVEEILEDCIETDEYADGDDYSFGVVGFNKKEAIERLLKLFKTKT